MKTVSEGVENASTPPSVGALADAAVETPSDQMLAPLSRLSQLKIASDVKGFEAFAAGIRAAFHAPPPLVEGSQPSQSAEQQAWVRTRLEASALAIEKILSIEDVLEAPNGVELMYLLNEAAQFMKDLGPDDPEWSGHLCGKIKDVHYRTFLAREVSLGMPPELPVDTMDELQHQPHLARVEFFRGYFATRKAALADQPKIEYIETVPLRINVEHRLYLDNPDYTKEYFRETGKFSDGEGAQGEAMKELAANNRLSYFAVSSVERPWSERCIHAGVASNIEDYENGRFLVRYARLIDQPIEETVVSVLKKNKGFAGLRDYNGEFGSDFFEEAKAQGLVENIGSYINAFKPEVREDVARELVKTPLGAKNFVNGLENGPTDTVFSKDVYLQLINQGYAYDVISDHDHFPKVPFEEALAHVRGNRKAVDGLLAALWQLDKGAALSRAVMDVFVGVCGLENVVEANVEAFNAEAQNALVLQAFADEEVATKVSLGYCSRLTLSTAEQIMRMRPRAAIELARSIHAFAQQDQSALIGRLLDQAPELAPRLIDSVPHLRGLDVECCLRLFSAATFDNEQAFFKHSASSFTPEAQTVYADKLFTLNKDAFLSSLGGYDAGVIPARIADALVESKQTRWVIQYRRCFKDDFGPDTIKKLDTFSTIEKKISASPSRTVRRMESPILDGLMDADDPEAAYARIDTVFLRNHIPLAGKTMLAFETIYGREHYQRAYSPTLKEASPRESRMLIYRDLLNIHLDSGNPSLRLYLEDIQRASRGVDRVKSGEVLSKEEERRVEEFLRSVAVLHGESMYGQSKPGQGPEKLVGSLQERIHAWERSLGVRNGQSLQDRLAEMFLRPAGVQSVQAALDRMEASKKTADTENRAFAEKAVAGTICLQEGDLLKGVESRFLVSFLQNGNVCKELLGYAAKMDSTPLDTDLERLDAKSAALGVAAAYKGSLADDYGDMALVLRPNDNRFLRTTADQPANVSNQLFDSSYKYEQFTTGVLGDRHEGIRTGVPFTEVRAIILKEHQRRSVLDLKMDIVANGYYVPITDVQGTILFSPQEYDELRTLYAGTEVNKGAIPSIDRSVMSADQTEQIDAIREQIVNERESVEAIKTEIENKIHEALRVAGIPIRTSGELAVGAEIHNTGSTARGTSIPGTVVDFDIAIRLDETDLAQHGKISDALDAVLAGEKESGAANQWRRSGIEIQGKSVDIDVTYVSKPEVEGMPSHAVVEQRLRAVEQSTPQEADLVRANIVYAKQVLKRFNVYKKLDGGLGGLGVENWILQHGGSFAKARESVLRAAIDEQGSIRSFEDCAARYAIPDPGVNLTSDSVEKGATGYGQYRHDNFFYFLNRDGSDGYGKFIHALQHLAE